MTSIANGTFLSTLWFSKSWLAGKHISLCTSYDHIKKTVPSYRVTNKIDKYNNGLLRGETYSFYHALTRGLLKCVYKLLMVSLIDVTPLSTVLLLGHNWLINI